MSTPTPRLTEKGRASIESQLSKRFAKPTLKGMSRKLFSGDDVEKYVSPLVEELKSAAGKDIGARADMVQARLEKRLNVIFNHLIARVEAMLASIPMPQNGHTPTKEEILAIAEPALAELRTSFEKQLRVFSETEEGNEDTPAEMQSFDEMMKKAIKKYAPKRGYGGGGPKAFYELTDVPGKTERFGPAPYHGYENKYLRVKSDGTGLEWVDVSVGSSNLATEEVTATDAGGNNVDIDLTQLAHAWTTIQLVTRNGQILDQNRWSVAADVLTVTGAVTTNSFQVQYTY